MPDQNPVADLMRSMQDSEESPEVQAANKAVEAARKAYFDAEDARAAADGCLSIRCHQDGWDRMVLICKENGGPGIKCFSKETHRITVTFTPADMKIMLAWLTAELEKAQ